MTRTQKTAVIRAHIDQVRSMAERERMKSKGATHHEGERFFKKVGDWWYVWRDGWWVCSGDVTERYCLVEL